MSAPPVQYVKTSDGYDIAFTIEGVGRILVVVPLSYSHLQMNRGPEFPWIGGLAERYRLIRYDSRGQGMSTRGLPAGISAESYVLDLEAVVERLSLDRFVLYGYGNALGHVAIRYAASHPEKVEGLVLQCSAIETTAWPMAMSEDLARQDWDAYAQVQSRAASEAQDFTNVFNRLQQSTTQQDWLALMAAFRPSNVTDLLPRLTMPVLVLHPRDFHGLHVEESMKMAASLPNASLVMIDGSSSMGDVTQSLEAIGGFTTGLPPTNDARQVLDERLPSHLSAREAEVLRLLTAGKSNQQIADDLVISLNTVNRHVSNIYAKLGASNRAQAAVYAQQHGLV